MTKIRDLPLLAILPVDKLILHEYHDPQRTPPIARAISESGTLRNPPIVVPLRDETNSYMVLDGANRVTAIQSLGIEHIVVQVIPADDPGLGLTPWHHVVWGPSSSDLVDWMLALPEVIVKPGDSDMMTHYPQSLHTLAVISCPNNEYYQLLTSHHKLLQRMQTLNRVVDAYKDRATLDRTLITDMESLEKIYPHLSGLVMLPQFRIDEILYIVSEGYLMPPGSTRFTISPRVLHLNFPLAELAEDKSLEDKNIALQAWMNARLAAKRVRYYAESTYLFDE